MEAHECTSLGDGGAQIGARVARSRAEAGGPGT
jgi:hypothetical protein